MAHVDDDDFVDENADDDRWCAQQDVVDEAHHGREFTGASEFRHIGAGENTDRCAEDYADAGHDQATEDCVAQAAGTAGRWRYLREDMQLHPGQSVFQQGPQQPHQPDQAEYRGQHGNRHVEPVDKLASCVDIHGRKLSCVFRHWWITA